MRSILNVFLTVSLTLLAAPFLCATLLHVLTSDTNVVLAALHGGIGWWLLPSAPIGVLALLLGRKKIAFSCFAAALAHAARVLPGHWPPSPPEPGAPTLAIGTSNLFAHNPTPERLAQELLDLDPDLWCLQELTHPWRERLDSEEMAARWPHRYLHPQEGGFGIGIVSDRPLEVQFVDLAGVPMAIAQLEGLTLLCVHPEPPRSQRHTARWRTQHQALRAQVASIEGPLIVAGDLNATRHHPIWRRLLREASLHDAHAEVGRASAWSWPAPPYVRFLPPWRLDHVLLSAEIHALSAREGSAHGSDHRPIVVQLQR